MATKLEDIIELPENPDGSGFNQEQWNEIMTSIWVQWWRIHYRTHRDEIDVSLQDFTNKVFTQLGKYVEALESAEKTVADNSSAVSVPVVDDTHVAGNDGNERDTDPEDDTDPAITT